MREYLPDGTCYKSSCHYSVFYKGKLLEAVVHTIENQKGWLSRDELGYCRGLENKWAEKLGLDWKERTTICVDRTEDKVDPYEGDLWGKKSPPSVVTDDDGFKYSAVVVR